MTPVSEQSHFCRICGLDQGEPPWGEDGKTPAFIICDCCGIEAGYEDCTIESAKRARKVWLDRSGNWWAEKRRPIDWSLEEQLEQIPAEYQ